MTKKELREKYKRLRKEIYDKDSKDKLITKKVLLSDAYKKANTIAIYVSKEDEVDTRELIKKCLEDGKTVCIPVVYSEGKDMDFYQIDSLEGLHLNQYGVLEPDISVRNLVFSFDIDLFIVPMLAFDQEGNRLGYGGGYYDKYLKKSIGYKLGIAYDIQMAASVEAENTDVRMDEIITENRLVKGKKL